LRKGKALVGSRPYAIAAMVLLLMLLALFVRKHPHRGDITVVAKGGPYFKAVGAAPMSIEEARARDIAYKDLGRLTGGASQSLGYLSALPLTTGEALAWQSDGCGPAECLLVTFYDYDYGGTVEAVVNLDSATLVATWREQLARPGATAQVVPRALAAAADDPRVTSVLGDVRQSVPMMVPMSVWLADDACRQAWCVDLTFMAPDESGRVFHVVVNMEEDQVARTFYTRSRPDRSYTAPEAQATRYDNGCHEQYGWDVCWEMTVHDGIDFYGASFDGRLVFSSAKITQVEVYYPSWPGGYRDEIGHNASVPAYYGTQIVDLGDGFEVRQIYTEFLRWPNCICCYRYEQIMRFFGDGSFEPHFTSFGPGCDDLSTYRPFWRIDVDLDGPDNDRVWQWQGGTWREVLEERQLQLFGELSTEGAQLFMSGGGEHYLWKPVATDPLGQDEAFLFLLRYHEDEGVGPVAPGPALTYYPPAGWLNQEPLSGENVVVWYIPILKTRHGDPWWCMPDPEPDFSPCDAYLRVERTREDVAAAALAMPESAEPTPGATATPMPEETPTPTAIAEPQPTRTPRPVVGDDAETLLVSSGCAICHRIGDIGERGKVGPDLTNIGLEAARRVEGMSAEEYLRQSILDPGAVLAPECPNGPCLAGVMPEDYAQRLREEQVDILVEFLLEQRLDAGDGSHEEASPEESAPSPLTTGQVIVMLLLSLAIMVFMGLLAYARRPPDKAG
jgi:hypothetical protein